MLRRWALFSVNMRQKSRNRCHVRVPPLSGKNTIFRRRILNIAVNNYCWVPQAPFHFTHTTLQVSLYASDSGGTSSIAVTKYCWLSMPTIRSNHCYCTSNRGIYTGQIDRHEVLLKGITFVNTKNILIPKTIGNRKRDCAWGCARGIDTTWENLQIEKHKSVRWTERTPSWFVLFDLQIFSGGVYPPSATSRTISFSHDFQ